MDDRKTRRELFMFIAFGIAGLLVLLVIYWSARARVAEAAESRARTEQGAAAAGLGPPVLFIGSSTIARFPLAAAFPGKPWLNLGKPDENALRLRERLAKTETPAPAGIVLYAGSIDHRLEPQLSPKEVRERVEAVIDDLLGRFPGLRMQSILLLEILPARKQTAAERANLEAVNRALADLAASRHPDVKFMKTNRHPLIDGSGDLPEAMTVDRFHLNDEGYRVLAQWIREDDGAVGQLLR
jgi:lysophospholipase L1-like esterase